MEIKFTLVKSEGYYTVVRKTKFSIKKQYGEFNTFQQALEAGFKLNDPTIKDKRKIIDETNQGELFG